MVIPSVNSKENNLIWSKVWKSSVICTFVVLFLTACSFPSPTITETQSTLTPLATNTIVVNTPTPFPPSTDTPIPPPTSTPSFTPSSTPTLTPTLIPTATSEPSVRFAVIGDYGLAGDAEADVAALVLSWAPDFIITTGDNNYPNGSDETIDENVGQYFHSFISPYLGAYGEGANTNRFFPSLGNHDWLTDAARPYLDYFSLPGNERYYDFIWGPVQFFSIDSDPNEPDGVGSSSIQADWLREQLAASTSPWQIVYTHYPPYSSGAHRSTDWIQWPFKEWGADAVLSGHDHMYERLEVDDLAYFVNGLGGGSRYLFTVPLPSSMVRYRSNYGAMLVEASVEKIVFQFINRKNELIDEYTLWSAGR
jgi:tartrate-resistant acid phosphatase type 5